MKHKIIRSLLLIILFFILGSPSLYFDTLIPAVIDLPSDIDTVVLVDRSYSTNGFFNFIQKGFSGILGDTDPHLSMICITGLSSQINGSTGINAISASQKLKRPGSNLELPEPLDWIEVENICSKFNGDALLCIELFHIESHSRVAEVKVGYRLYNPHSRTILDQFQFYHATPYKSRVITPEGEHIRVASEDDAVYEAAFRSGVLCGRRLIPSWLAVERAYFERSKRDDNFAAGARMIEVSHWDAAIESFEKAYKDGHPKTKGKAAHNLALIHEILGDYEEAREWIRIAWGEYEIRESREYAQILDMRIAEVEKIRQQEMN